MLAVVSHIRVGGSWLTNHGGEVEPQLRAEPPLEIPAVDQELPLIQLKHGPMNLPALSTRQYSPDMNTLRGWAGA